MNSILWRNPYILFNGLNGRHEAVHGLSSEMYQHWIYCSESGLLFIKCLRVGNQKQVPNNSEIDAHLYFFQAYCKKAFYQHSWLG